MSLNSNNFMTFVTNFWFFHIIKYCWRWIIARKNYVLKDKNSIFIDNKAIIGDNVIIYENNRIEGECVIGDNVTIYPNSFISNTEIGKGTKIYSSFIEKSKIGSCCFIGPFAHLRAGSNIHDFAKIGNFCEIKNAEIGEQTKVSHLAYVGDAKVGKRCNVGCGAIFVNFNGKTKFKTVVEDDVFIGSNVNIIAPVTIGSGAYICAGTTVDKDIASSDFAIGRVRAEIKKNRAKQYLDKTT